MIEREGEGMWTSVGRVGADTNAVSLDVRGECEGYVLIEREDRGEK